LRLSLAWRTGLYGPDVANRLLDHYAALLHRLVKTPDALLPTLLAPVPAGQPLAPADATTTAAPGNTLPGAVAGPVERALAEIWTGLLGCREIGPDDDFFAAGGHSLLATRLIAAIADRLGVELPLVSVFEHPTIRGLARRIGNVPVNSARGAAPIPRLPRQPDDGGPP